MWHLRVHMHGYHRDPDFQRRAAGVMDRGQQHHPFARVDGLAKADSVNAERDHVARPAWRREGWQPVDGCDYIAGLRIR